MYMIARAPQCNGYTGNSCHAVWSFFTQPGVTEERPVDLSLPIATYDVDGGTSLNARSFVRRSEIEDMY